MHSQHFLLTRFNTAAGFVPSDLDMADWLTHRIPIFADVCLPSVVGQTRRPDHWLLGFDGRYPDRVSAVIRAIEPYPWIVPIWQNWTGEKPESLDGLFGRETIGRLRDDTGHVITTRLDNDDALNLNYVAEAERRIRRIQQVDDPADFWFAFTRGAQISRNSANEHFTPAPHFITRCTARSAFPANSKGAFGVRHTNLHQRPEPVYCYETSEPMWLEYVHEKNISNRIRTSLPKVESRRRTLDLFGLRDRPEKHPGPASRSDRIAAVIRNAASTCTRLIRSGAVSRS